MLPTAIPASPPSATLADLADRADGYAALSWAPATARAYAQDWRHYRAWCDVHGLMAAPAAPLTLTLYLTAHADRLSVATLERRLAAVQAIHRRLGLPLDRADRRLCETWDGIRRAHGRPAVGKRALTTAQLSAAVAALPDTLRGIRDRALLLLGYAGALRRSELTDLDAAPDGGGRAWLTRTPDGLLVTFLRSKENQDGHDAQPVAVPVGTTPGTCPVRAVDAWLARAGISDGPLFRSVLKGGRLTERRLSDEDVARAVKRAVAAVGLEARAYAGHSLRAGCITAAARAGCPEHELMEHSRHHDLRTMRRYIRDAKRFATSPAGRLGL